MLYYCPLAKTDGMKLVVREGLILLSNGFMKITLNYFGLYY